MNIPIWLGVAFTALAAVLTLLLAIKSELTRNAPGRVLAFLVLFILPVMASWGGFSAQMSRAESTRFCLSCHVMQDYGRSLMVDDPSFIPAVHYQNHLVPTGHACYTCHTTYTLFGPMDAKLEGLHHMYVEYLGTVPKPASIRLYHPYNNRECLHCHEGMRAFMTEPNHNKTPGLMAAILSDQKSCLSSGCHDTVHDIKDLGYASFWKPKP